MVFAAADQDVGNDADGAQNADRLLRRLGLHSPGGLDVRHQRDVHEQAVAAADLLPELADGLQKRQRFDIADRAADLGDDDIHIIRVQRADGLLDLVGDMRNHLHGLAEVAAFAFALDDGAVDPAGGEVAGLRAGNAPVKRS
jgi:hypothetical protein